MARFRFLFFHSTLLLIPVSIPHLAVQETLARSVLDNPALPVVSCSLSSSSTPTLVHVFILNRLDYCSSLCLGLPYVRLRPLDCVLRAAARLVGCVPKFGHIDEFMRNTLHWLPVRQRILYRVSTIAWRYILGVAPVYFSELLSYLRPVRVGDHFARPLVVTI